MQYIIVVLWTYKRFMGPWQYENEASLEIAWGWAVKNIIRMLPHLSVMFSVRPLHQKFIYAFKA